MQSDWKKFFTQLLEGHEVLSEFPETAGTVEKITVRESGQLLIHCSLSEPCPPALLCRLEEAVEETLKTGEAVICQRFESEPDPVQANEYVSALFPWILRHLWHQDAFLASLLSRCILQ